ncbi:hypothetical protein [Actinoplanes couchii]|uniref:Uncharacterized protein n=1 Tax=Actinoplanes couchii TaxID=403638 RepID=A0ABQ3XRM6_9ACTN|nr:hypothetical protein [Actinoplanes couchii]MDR6320011.1 hypothetical protein [Actinoplanes couchii]GID61050.1 hypothetical protein Aco03nite_094540 [Actinoplanes couchii]
MRTKSLIRIGAVAAAFGVLAPGAAHAAPKKRAVTITFAAAVDEARQGAAVLLSGRAGWSPAGNAATVDVFFRKNGSPGYTLLTSTKADARGSFRKTITAVSGGTFKAVYRGNSKRKTATATDGLRVWTLKTVTRTVFSHSEAGADCSAVPNRCRYTGPTVTLAHSPITVTGKMHCSTPKPGMGIAFTDAPDNSVPPANPGTPQAGPGWVVQSYYAVGTVVLSDPLSWTGHFHAGVGCPPYGQTRPIADWSVIATQDVPEKRFV